ncbi:hypothetical protein [Klebsiella pneumoniae]|uniref:hypothetical protein n=1 Tax=Klebsiella pneumoniae TaxID=573 RepID=UPI000E35C505|nr:hypothetical protein [Klebsiella pneumoniae]AXS44814.1 hypothetical protein D0896_10790 [Klebsiella pneumoniae]MBC4039300.1 hypothetical protein [Klebsiella pneumoniae]MBK2361311.1 hypothetical protein [Klebsiella pneumoniae]UNG25673.1 hypothetical protein LDH71_19240 [Klebsiella pneumoniae]WKV44755.1 hypothetical protein MHK77_19190 [Klebsiella pneumoniae]
MTSKLARERLEEIKSWRETYGAGINVMLPAEEAEELACIALAAMDSEPVAYTDERNLGYIDRGRETAYLWGKQNSEASDVALYRHAQPAPVVPDEIKHRIGGLDWGWEGEFNRGWNACRAAMLKENPVCTCPTGDGSLRWPCSVHPGNSPATSDNWKVEAEKLAEMHGMSFVLFRHGEAPQCADPTKVVISFTDKGLGHDPLPAAPQEVR